MKLVKGIGGQLQVNPKSAWCFKLLTHCHIDSLPHYPII